MIFDFKATVTITADQVPSLISYAIEKKYGLKIEPERFQIQYNGDYDTTSFDGFTVELNLNEAKEINDGKY